MAAFNFPNSPNQDDTHTENGVQWKYDGTVWKRVASAGPAGAQGSPGSTGAQGAPGSTGPTGPTRLNGFGHISGLNGTNGSSSGSMNRSYNVSSHSGNFSSNDSQYDGGMTVNWSSAIGTTNYTVVLSTAGANFGTWNSYSTHPWGITRSLTNLPMQAYDIASASFKLRGFAHYGNTDDSSITRTFPTNIHFAAFDT